MTALNMENVIAAALAKHQWYDATTDSEDPATGCTGCDDWFSDEYAVENGTFAAHQARAVLAAIIEAGTVEWGVEYGWTSDQGQFESEVAVKRTEALARHEAAFEGSLSTIGEIEGPAITVVSRVTFPWQWC